MTWAMQPESGVNITQTAKHTLRKVFSDAPRRLLRMHQKGRMSWNEMEMAYRHVKKDG